MTEQNSTSWDSAALTFDEAPDHGLLDPEVRQAWGELIRQVLPLEHARVADLGCGTGSLSVLVGELGHTVDGVDFSNDMLEVARTKAAAGAWNVRFHLGDASAPPLPARHYDVVLCRHLLWALPNPAAALLAWRDLLIPGGRVVLIEGRWSTGSGLAATDVAELLDDAGFEAAVTKNLTDPQLWGGPVSDHRYLTTAVPRT